MKTSYLAVPLIALVAGCSPYPDGGGYSGYPETYYGSAYYGSGYPGYYGDRDDHHYASTRRYEGRATAPAQQHSPFGAPGVTHSPFGASAPPRHNPAVAMPGPRQGPPIASPNDPRLGIAPDWANANSKE